MRGQKPSTAQAHTVERLAAKGWRVGDMFRLHVSMCRDRPARFGRWPQHPLLPDPCVIHVRRDGSVHRGYPTHRNPH